MRKCTATVIYKDNRIYNLTVNYKGSLTPLVRYDLDDREKPYEYESLKDLYESVLKILKNNGYYTSSYNEFNLKWYDIQFINLRNPTRIEKSGLFEEE